MGEGGMEVVVEGEYIPIATLSPSEWPALRWAAMRAVLIFINCEGQSHKTVSTGHNFWREKRAEAVSNRGPSAYQPTALPLGQTGWYAEGPRFRIRFGSPLFKSCGLWTLPCDFVPHN